MLEMNLTQLACLCFLSQGRETQRLEEHHFITIKQQHSLQTQLHDSCNLSPRAYSRNLFLPPPHQLQQKFCLRKEQDPEELFSPSCCNIQSECYYQLLETGCIESTDDVCIF